MYLQDLTNKIFYCLIFREKIKKKYDMDYKSLKRIRLGKIAASDSKPVKQPLLPLPSKEARYSPKREFFKSKPSSFDTPQTPALFSPHQTPKATFDSPPCTPVASFNSPQGTPVASFGSPVPNFDTNNKTFASIVPNPLHKEKSAIDILREKQSAERRRQCGIPLSQPEDSFLFEPPHKVIPKPRCVPPVPPLVNYQTEYHNFESVCKEKFSSVGSHPVSDKSCIPTSLPHATTSAVPSHSTPNVQALCSPILPGFLSTPPVTNQLFSLCNPQQPPSQPPVPLNRCATPSTSISFPLPSSQPIISVPPLMPNLAQSWAPPPPPPVKVESSWTKPLPPPSNPEFCTPPAPPMTEESWESPQQTNLNSWAPPPPPVTRSSWESTQHTTLNTWAQPPPPMNPDPWTPPPPPLSYPLGSSVSNGDSGTADHYSNNIQVPIIQSNKRPPPPPVISKPLNEDELQVRSVLPTAQPMNFDSYESGSNSVRNSLNVRDRRESRDSSSSHRGVSCDSADRKDRYRRPYQRRSRSRDSYDSSRSNDDRHGHRKRSHSRGRKHKKEKRKRYREHSKKIEKRSNGSRSAERRFQENLEDGEICEYRNI